MIALALHVILFLLAALPPGVALVSWLSAEDGVERRGDRLVLSLWLGLLAGGAVLLAVALVTPLTPPVFFAYLAGCFSFALSARVRDGIRRIVRGARPVEWAASLLLLAAAVSIGAGPINNRDAISYQHDIVQWLSDTGVAPGLSLIERRFGFLSSWYTYGALANHGWMRARAGSLANTLALLLALLHLWVAVTRLLGRRSRPADLFLVAALPLALAMPLALNVPVSTSPDFPAVVLSVVCAWSFLVLPRGRNASVALLPVLLAAGALIVKLSAMPLLAVAGLHWLGRRPRPADWAKAAACAVCLIVPWMAGMTMVSGCPLYPVPVALDVPWANPEGARIDTEAVRLYARWHQGTLPEEAARIAYPSVEWLRRWLAADVSNAVGFALFLLSMAAVAAVALRRGRMAPGAGWALGTGLAGILYVVLMAPVPRFGWGFLAIPTGVLLSTGAGSATGRPRFAAAPAAGAMLAVALILIPVLALGRMTGTASGKRLRAWMEREAPYALRTPWLLPPEIPLIRYDDRAGVALALRGFRPAEGRMEPSSRPMYYPLEPGPGVRYRNPDRGAAAGFVRVEERAQ
ncbi:MAG: hypothetical protein KJ579_12765 [Verrucomicrobia bacterium]|nr:hypothetical protein [Verrucomicrobiota bacterium]